MGLTNVDIDRIDGSTGTLSTLTTTALTTSTLNGLAYPTSGSLSGRNRIINGDMRIDQRNSGASMTATTAAEYSLDRWRTISSASSKFSVQRNAGSVTPPAGFTNYLGVTSLAATTVASGDYYLLDHRIEGFNVADLAFGTANAATVTLSFWVRSSLTGTFGGALTNNATRSYPFTYSISAANTWERKTITIAGDTAGTWATDNTAGMTTTFALGVGSTYKGTAGAWAGATYWSASGAVDLVSTNGATFYITGVQLEAGSVATPFERRSYGQELALCQRYCFAITGNNQTFSTISYGNATSVLFYVAHPVTMRASTTVTSATGTNYYAATIGATVDYVNSLSFYVGSPSFTALLNNSEASGTAGQAGYGSTTNASASIVLSAEL